MADRSNTYFISYSRSETGFVRRLASDLENKDVEVWWDQMDLSGGDRWDRVIEETLEQCRGVIVVLSQTSVISNSVADEWSYALDHNKPVYTVKYEECEVPMRLRRVNWIDFTEDHADGFGKLLESLAVKTENPAPLSGSKPSRPEVRSGNPMTGGIVIGILLLVMFSWWMWNREAPSDDDPVNQEMTIAEEGNSESSSNQGSETREPEPEPDPFVPLLPEMVSIPGGSMLMGNAEDPRRFARVERDVTLDSFEMSTTEITNEQWQSCIDGGFCDSVEAGNRASGRKHPVVWVSWNDAQDYINFLNHHTDGNWSLPSEAQWEYAARGNTNPEAERTNYFWGNELPDCGRMHERGARFDGCGVGAFPVGSFQANAFGLYDMHGNVWEWVQDCVHMNYEGAPVDGSAWLLEDGGNCDRRVMRGGAWDNQPGLLTSWHRNLNDDADNTYDSLGFRVVRN